MFKFLHRSHGRASEARLKDKQGKDIFEFKKTVEHGFPHKPSAVAHDPKLSLLAIGTSNGGLKIFGKPGVELSARHQVETRIQELHFLPEQGRVISVCDDGEQNSIHLWEVNKKNGKSVLEEVKTCTLEGRLKKISVCCLSMKTDRLYLGTEGGNIYLLDINSFELQDYVIYQDILMQSVQEENKVNAGSVEAIEEHPQNSDQILIGYKKGLIVLWNHKSCSAETFPGSQDLESVSWSADGDKFVSAHADGSLTKWLVGEESENRQDTSTPFGPFPCKAITKVEWHDTNVFFAGGMPRASYGDRNCVSVMQGTTTQVVFDFTSKVVDFFTLTDPDEGSEPTALAVQCEQEFVVIDLKTKDHGYPTFMKPYLACLHSSSITTSLHCHDCPAELWEQISAAGREQFGAEFSKEPWPISGGKSLVEKSDVRDLLVTGHEDGSARFWDVSEVRMQLLYSLSTSKFFASEHEGHDNGVQDAEEEGWPPFKKVGNFDPYSDDPRFSVQKIVLCSKTRTLTVAGAGGQVVMFGVSSEESSVEMQLTEIELIQEKDHHFEWKGHGPLTAKEGSITVPRGFVPQLALQLNPAAPVTALSTSSDLGLLAAGTAHGFALFDYSNKKVVTTKCTLSKEALTGTGEPISRKKTLKRSIRDSIRRLRRSRKGTYTPKKDRKDGAEAAGSPSGEAPVSPPVSRLVDENRVDETVLSMVRCLYFADTFLKDGEHHIPSLWAGTNAGHIYVHYLSVPGQEKRSEQEVGAEMGKEIKLKHKAPVVSIFVVDKNGMPLVGEVEDDKEKGPDMSGQHSLVICSEEQFKVFSLPHLKARHKEKLTAIDGSRVRKIGLVNARSKNDDSGTVYHCLACLSNQGDLAAYTIPHLKLQSKASCVKKEDIIAIQSLVFTTNGQGFYLCSPSEMQKFALTASEIVSPDCLIELADGMRKPEPEPQPEIEATVAAAVEAAVEEGEEKKRKDSSSSSSSSDEEKKEKEEEKKEEETKEEEEKKEEEQKECPDDSGLEVIEVSQGDVTSTETREITMSEEKSFHRDVSEVSETAVAEQKTFAEETSVVESSSETSSSVVTTSRVVTSKKVVTQSSSTTHRVITSVEGDISIEALEGAIQNGNGEQITNEVENEVNHTSEETDGAERNNDPTADTKKKRGKGFKSPGKLFSKKKSGKQTS